MKNNKNQWLKDNLLFLFGSVSLAILAFLICEFLSFVGAVA